MPCAAALPRGGPHAGCAGARGAADGRRAGQHDVPERRVGGRALRGGRPRRPAARAAHVGRMLRRPQSMAVGSAGRPRGTHVHRRTVHMKGTKLRTLLCCCLVPRQNTARRAFPWAQSSLTTSEHVLRTYVVAWASWRWPICGSASSVISCAR